MPPSLPDPRPYCATLPDPRRAARNQLHRLEDILMITLCAVLGRLARRAFGEAFRALSQAALPSLAGEQVCLDGKTAHGKPG